MFNFLDIDSSVQYAVLLESDKSLKISVPLDLKWIKINENQEGLFRVQYPSNILQNLKSSLTSLSAINRFFPPNFFY